ncbi:hypothetical protein [Hyalangium rubrum]|uniref:Lipoprotein n=1 Tax=Hyalangium rubrum TaxID=3103134 RepID=A0ABU5HID2_9BACT|nr:hypothetical protein [Hyalangium sp. s54d21]MDY7233228.1 hypothetical protein [Hyalangium sp. s54d21]
MKLRHVVVASVVLTTVACAPIQKQGTAPTGGTAVKIGNQLPFDAASCSTSTKLPANVTPNGLLGALATARPAVMECLVAPTSRGPAQTSKVLVKASLSEQAGTYTITGENLTPEGQACVQKVMETGVPLAPIAKGAQPVSVEIDFSHEAGRSLGVTMGENPVSDYSGAVRLGQAQWCDCYAPFATTVPPTLKANIKLTKAQPNPTDVSFDPAGSPEGDALAACLKGKMMALPVAATDDIQFTRNFTHFNSKATEPAANMTPEYRFFQLELSRNLRTAEANLALGAHEGASDAYDSTLMKSQKAKGKMAGEVTAKCQQLMDAGNAWVSALQAQQKAEQATLASATELKAKDAMWAQAEGQLQQVTTRTQEDLTNAQSRIKSDQEACARK